MQICVCVHAHAHTHVWTRARTLGYVEMVGPDRMRVGEAKTAWIQHIPGGNPAQILALVVSRSPLFSVIGDANNSPTAAKPVQILKEVLDMLGVGGNPGPPTLLQVLPVLLPERPSGTRSTGRFRLFVSHQRAQRSCLLSEPRTRPGGDTCSMAFP